MEMSCKLHRWHAKRNSDTENKITGNTPVIERKQDADALMELSCKLHGWHARRKHNRGLCEWHARRRHVHIQHVSM